MKILKYGDIFNVDTLNIFTDASITKLEYETLGCPGVVLVRTDENGNNHVINTHSYIVNHSTNNDSEIKAIRTGILCGLGYRNYFKRINLFSDSNICVQGLKDWIFNWMNCVVGKTMYSSSGMPVANQEVFMSIIHILANANLEINIYHQKGHVIINSDKSLNKAKNSMIRSNGLDDIDMNLVIQLSIYNDMVDRLTKDHLNIYYNSEYIFEQRQKELFKVKSVDKMIHKIPKYKKLIGGNTKW